jgi:hypothetical protein
MNKRIKVNKREIKINQVDHTNHINQSSDNYPVIARSAATKQSVTEKRLKANKIHFQFSTNKAE